jgi:Holliday junction resolvasome RuvABC endonuclease subunit
VEASSRKFKNDLQGRTSGVAGIIKLHACADCLGVCIEEPFSGQFSSVKALFPMLGAAALACEQEGLPWSTAHLAKLKIHATGKGNAKKPNMQAAAKVRWGIDLGEDEADAAWAGAFALDCGIFTN